MNNLRFLAGLASVVMATFVSAAPQPPVETTSITPTPAFFSSRFALDGNRIRLTLTLTNPNPSPLGVIVAAFSNGDAYNLGGAIPSNAMNSCGGTLDLLGYGIAIENGTIPANGSCTAATDILAFTPGSYTFTGSPALTIAGPSNATSATLNVIAAAPTVAKSFSPSTVGTGIPSMLTITISNPNPMSFASLSFTDTYPGGLVNAASPNASSTCGNGAVTAIPGGNSISLSSSDYIFGDCTVSVSVVSPTPGNFSNTIAAGSITSTGVLAPQFVAFPTSNASPASASLSVIATTPAVGTSALLLLIMTLAVIALARLR